MAKEKTILQERIDSGKNLLLAEILPPKSSDPGIVRAAAKGYAGKVHALGVSDNRDGVRMSAMAAALLVASENVEPVLHITTRDRNRVALISYCLGAQAMGIGNILCTSGTHQVLDTFRMAKNVFDIDSVQLLQVYSGLQKDGSIIGEEGFENSGHFCLGAVASPEADPLELQVMRLDKKIKAGAQFLITQPVYDIDRFDTWWKEVTSRGIHERVAIIAGIRPLTDFEGAKAVALKRPLPLVPEDMLKRLGSEPDKESQYKTGIKTALETIKHLSSLKGLRGFEIVGEGDDDAALEVIEQSGLGTE